MKTARIVRTRHLSEGITGSLRVTLTDGRLTHDAHIQTVDIYRPVYDTGFGIEINFRDTYKHNIAAYLLDKLLNLYMVPVSIERSYMRKPAAFTWWVDDVIMSEKERYLRKIRVPNVERWNRQIYIVRVFDELIYNIDRNLGNLLITKDWEVWMIDHTRAFRPYKWLRNPKNLEKCDRYLYLNLCKLTRQDIEETLSRYLTPYQIDGLLYRRDRIIEFFDKKAKREGQENVFYEYLPRKCEPLPPISAFAGVCRSS